MRNSTGTVAIVPSHPLDVKGKTPLNLPAGAFAVTSRGVTGALPVASSGAWKVENKPARDIMQNQLAEVAAPARVARTMAASGGTSGMRVTAGSGSSTIVYDRAERRFVNSDNAKSTEQGQASVRIQPEQSRTGNATRPVPPASERATGRERQSAVIPIVRTAAPPRPTVAPPSVPRTVMTERAFSGSGGSGVGSSRGSGSGVSGGSSSRGSVSSGSAGSSPSAGARSSGGGGRPH